MARLLRSCLVNPMIISHKHKFIFIKTRKTAGTSIEISLSRYCGPEDVLTPLWPPEDEQARRRFGKRDQNWWKPVPEWSAVDVRRLLKKRKWPRSFWNHIPAWKVRQCVGAEIWDSYFKFCFERNPWEKTLSYYFHKGQLDHDSLDDFLRRGEFKQYNYPLYSASGEVIVDRVCRFETLAEDLADVCDRIGLDFDGWLPKAKSKARGDRRPYWKILTEKQMDLIQERLAEEVELLDYKAVPSGCGSTPLQRATG